MDGRHSADERRRSRPVGVTPLVLGAGVIAFVLAVGLVIRWQTGGEDATASATCDETVSVAASPAIADAVTGVVESSNEGCGEYDISSRAAADVAKSITAGEDIPDVWIPDSTVDVDRVASEAETPPVVLESSIAASPVVVASAQSTKARWTDVLAGDAFVLGDPATSVPAVFTLVTSQAEAEAAGVSESAIRQSLVSLAQFGSRGSKASGPKRVKQIVSKGGTTVTSEQQAIAAGVAGSDGSDVYVPESGTLALDYPLVLSAPEDRRKTRSPGVDALAKILTSKAAGAMLAKAGFRAPDGKPLKRGVGDVKTRSAPSASDVSALVGAWKLLSRPSRTLAVIDVSGSMEYAAGDSSRMALAIEAAQQGQELFPDDSSLGLWAFSVELGKKGEDHLALVPIRPLGAEVGDSTQRAVVQEAVSGLIDRTGGGTGLYDSVLAAYRHAQKGYDPDAVNSVIVLTDGENEDPDSMSLNELLDTLESEANPKKPVVIITIGITEDADESALEAIAHVTGGTSHIALEPEDISNVFVEALASRGALPAS